MKIRRFWTFLGFFVVAVANVSVCLCAICFECKIFVNHQRYFETLNFIRTHINDTNINCVKSPLKYANVKSSHSIFIDKSILWNALELIYEILSFFLCVVTVAIGSWGCGDDDDNGDGGGDDLDVKCAESRAKLLMPYFSMSLLRYLKLPSYRSDRPRLLHSQLTSLYVIHKKKLWICKTNHVNKSQKIDFVRALFDQSVIWIWCHFTADLFLHQKTFSLL